MVQKQQSKENTGNGKRRTHFWELFDLEQSDLRTESNGSLSAGVGERHEISIHRAGPVGSGASTPVSPSNPHGVPGRWDTSGFSHVKTLGLREGGDWPEVLSWLPAVSFGTNWAGSFAPPE